MKLLHTSDWHIGRSLFEFSLLEDQRDIFEQLCKIIEAEQIDALLISGDLYDRSLPSAQAVSLLDEMFTTLISRFHIPVLAVSGNHDSARRIAYGSQLFEQSGLYLEGGWKPELKKVTLSDSYGPVHFFLLPHFVASQVRLGYDDSSIHSSSEAFAQIIRHNLDAIPQNERCVLLAHGFFICQKAHEETPAPECSGSETAVGASDLTDLSCARELFDYIALGHLHRAQKAGSDSIRYSGSPLKYSVDEANNSKSVTIVELKEKGEIDIRTVPLSAGRDLRLICGTIDELCDPALASDDYIFAQLVSQGPVLGAMSRLREVYPHTLGLSFRQTFAQTPVEPGEDLASLPPDELFSRFYNQVIGNELDASHQAVVTGVLHSISDPDAE